MRRLVIALACFGAILASAADTTALHDPWAKVRDLKTGTEVRVFKKGSVKAIVATLNEATDDNLIVDLKNQEIAIPREEIDRIDYRPPQTSSRVSSETHTADHPATGGPPNPRSDADLPSTESSSSVSFGGKPDFQTIYRRPPPSSAPKK